MLNKLAVLGIALLVLTSGLISCCGEDEMSLNGHGQDVLKEPYLSLYKSKGIFWHTFFQSIDGFEKEQDGSRTGIFTVDGIELDITTGNVLNDTNRFYKYPYNEPLLVSASWAKQRRFQTVLEVGQITNQEIYVTIGAYQTLEHVGFKIVDDTIYGTVANGTNQSLTSALETLVSPTYLRPKLEAIFIPNVEVQFWIDEVFKGRLTTNLPSPSSPNDYQRMFMFTSIQTKEALNKVIYFAEWMFLQEP